MTDTTDMPIGVGDVALDLAQGRPVHVVNATGQTAAEWSDANNYDLVDNYGNDRLGASADDRVYDVVYCSNAKSEPSKTYAMPAPRLLRIETEAADGGRPVYQRAVRDTIETLLLAVSSDDMRQVIVERATPAFGNDLVTEAAELADVERTIGNADDGGEE